MPKSKIQWLGTKTVNGIEFSMGDNGCQLFYETKQSRTYWVILRGKGAKEWVALCERKGALRTLNCCHIHFDNQREEDPLYNAPATGDEPIALLAALADYIHQGIDPFRKKKGVVA